MRRLAVVLCALAPDADVSACGRITRDVRVVADRPTDIAELWQEPSNIERRDLFHGPGGSGLMPRDSTFVFPRDMSGVRDMRPPNASGLHDGAGLGLALARWIAHAHGGDVILARTSPSGSMVPLSRRQRRIVEAAPTSS